MTEEIEDDLTSLRKEKNQTPLSFYLKIGNSYLFSVNKAKGKIINNLVPVLIGRFCLYLPILIAELVAVLIISNLPEIIRNIITGLLIAQFIFYMCLFCLDPGTIFEDEEEIYNGDRYLCQNCRLYRYYTTKHCTFCQKCVRGYDHHCSFFGKCIGKRNFPIFCLFIMLSMFCGVLSIGSVGYTFVSSF